MEYKIFRISDEVYDYYISEVKNNKNESRDIATKKLSRNVHCSKCAGERDGKSLHYYGNLALLVKDDEIVWIHNYRDKINNFNIDFELKNKLDMEFGLVEPEEIDPKYEGVSILHKVMAWFGLHN